MTDLSSFRSFLLLTKITTVPSKNGGNHRTPSSQKSSWTSVIEEAFIGTLQGTITPLRVMNAWLSFFAFSVSCRHVQTQILLDHSSYTSSLLAFQQHSVQCMQAISCQNDWYCVSFAVRDQLLRKKVEQQQKTNPPNNFTLIQSLTLRLALRTLAKMKNWWEDRECQLVVDRRK